MAPWKGEGPPLRATRTATPKKIEQLPGRLNSKNSLLAALRQAKTFAAFFASVDPAVLTALGVLLWEGAR